MEHNQDRHVASFLLLEAKTLTANNHSFVERQIGVLRGIVEHFDSLDPNHRPETYYALAREIRSARNIIDLSHEQGVSKISPIEVIRRAGNVAEQLKALAAEIDPTATSSNEGTTLAIVDDPYRDIDDHLPNL